MEQANLILIKANYELILDDISNQLVISKKTLQRAFSGVTGISPKQYLSGSLFEEIVRQVSINQEVTTKQFLVSPFYDFSHINKCFKKFTNFSPSEFSQIDMGVIADVLSTRD